MLPGFGKHSDVLHVEVRLPDTGEDRPDYKGAIEPMLSSLYGRARTMGLADKPRAEIEYHFKSETGERMYAIAWVFP
jgi:hypothetical protein